MLLASLALSAEAWSIDEFNTYRWNRDNVIRNTGRQDKGPWYEWWYYKVVLPETGHSFFFVYGVVNPWDVNGKNPASRAHLGMGDFSEKIIVERHFSPGEFSARHDETYASIRTNTMTDRHFTGEMLNEDGQVYRWDIDIQKIWSFNATGWATGRMWTNIEWYPAQADALCSGTIESAGKTYDFKDAPCYQDRNWGHSFPDWWAWIVSNHFNGHPETALAIGGGRPRFFGGQIPLIEGVAIGLRHQGQVHTFRPNDLDQVKIDINFGKWEVVGINPTHKIEIKAHAPKESFMDLQFMTPQGEVFHDYETLTGDVEVKLYKRVGLFGREFVLVDTLTSNFTGIEYGSASEEKLNDYWEGSKTLFSNF